MTNLRNCASFKGFFTNVIFNCICNIRIFLCFSLGKMHLPLICVQAAFCEVLVCD